ncbi:MAG: hypothetical protein LBT40_00170 [Deltaproteobacteria bacterium]|nr:hypothetical protein [Deltaproteobacteria bacterium]
MPAVSDLLLDSHKTATKICGPRHPLGAEAQGESFGSLDNGYRAIFFPKLSFDATQMTGGT